MNECTRSSCVHPDDEADISAWRIAGIHAAKRLIHATYRSKKPCGNFSVPSLLIVPSSAIKSSLKGTRVRRQLFHGAGEAAIDRIRTQAAGEHGNVPLIHCRLQCVAKMRMTPRVGDAVKRAMVRESRLMTDETRWDTSRAACTLCGHTAHRHLRTFVVQ